MKAQTLFFLIILCFLNPNLQAQRLTFEDSLTYVINQKADKYVILDAHFELVTEVLIDGEEEKGNFYAKKMDAFARANDIKSIEGLLLLTKSYQAFYNKNDIKTAINYMFDALSVLELAADTSFLIKSEYAHALNELGNYFENLSAYDDALDYYLKSLDYSTKNECIAEKIDVYNNLSFLYSKNFNDPKKGIQYLKDALKLANKFNRNASYSLTYGNLGMEYLDQKDYENASYYLEKVIEVDKLAKDTFGLSFNYLQEAKLFLEQNKIKQAQESIQKALSFSKDAYDWKPDVHIAAGRIYLKSNNITKADFHFKEALKYARKRQDLNDQYNALRELVAFTKKRNNSDETLKYYNLMFAVKDSMDNQWKIGNVMKTEARTRVKRIKAEKEAIELDKKILAATIHEQQRFIFLVVLCLVIALAASVIIFSQKQKLQQANLLLVQKTQALTLDLKKQKQVTTEVKQIEKIQISAKQEQNVELLKKLETDLSQKIKIALEEEKVFLDNKLTLAKFAQQLNTNTSYLSKAINSIYNKPFRSLINEYRIKEVLLLFETEVSKQLTIFALAQKAGFSSKSSFNTAFREYTGVTPTFYLKNMKSDPENRHDL